MLGMTFTGGEKIRTGHINCWSEWGSPTGPRTSRSAISVGEQQRVAVARSLANRPALLLADEPTANVDPANQQMIVDLIRDTCREENISLLMVTHANEVAAQFKRVDRLDEVNHVFKKRDHESLENRLA